MRKKRTINNPMKKEDALKKIRDISPEGAFMLSTIAIPILVLVGIVVIAGTIVLYPVFPFIAYRQRALEIEAEGADASE
jgi:hypothetical protein